MPLQNPPLTPPSKTLYILSVPLGHCKVAITNSDMITPFEGHTQSNRPRSPCPRNIIAHVRNNYHTGVCTTRGCHAPCACYGCTLYMRLRAWMPKELRYCPKCHKFTKRDEKKPAKKKQNGICTSPPSPMKAPSNSPAPQAPTTKSARAGKPRRTGRTTRAAAAGACELERARVGGGEDGEGAFSADAGVILTRGPRPP